jgi:hypothetical protein
MVYTVSQDLQHGEYETRFCLATQMANLIGVILTLYIILPFYCIFDFFKYDIKWHQKGFIIQKWPVGQLKQTCWKQLKKWIKHFPNTLKGIKLSGTKLQVRNAEEEENPEPFKLLLLTHEK